MNQGEFDFYDRSALNAYNLNKTMRYQLSRLESCDKITRRHSENVASIVCRMCEYLHFDKRFIAYCTMSAYLHDIGKMCVPPEILHKPAKLTDEEYAIMKGHTTAGYDICMNDRELKPFAEAVRWHHECLDGTGYPDGLKKKAIPVEDQIIKVADEYDALVTKRQYKTHVNISETLKELIKDTDPIDMKEVVALDNAAEKSKHGKMSKLYVRTLFKVVIDDTEYEICGVLNYVKYLKEEISRLKLAKKFLIKMRKSRREKRKLYFNEGVEVLLKRGETLENVEQVLEDYKQTLKVKVDDIRKLYLEIKIIKKLKV